MNLVDQVLRTDVSQTSPLYACEIPAAHKWMYLLRELEYLSFFSLLSESIWSVTLSSSCFTDRRVCEIEKMGTLTGWLPTMKMMSQPLGMATQPSKCDDGHPFGRRIASSAHFQNLLRSWREFVGKPLSFIVQLNRINLLIVEDFQIFFGVLNNTHCCTTNMWFIKIPHCAWYNLANLGKSISKKVVLHVGSEMVLCEIFVNAPIMSLRLSLNKPRVNIQAIFRFFCIKIFNLCIRFCLVLRPHRSTL